MTNTNNNPRAPSASLSILTVAIAATLSACGGGGGGGTPAATSAPVAPVVLASTLATTVLPTTYSGEQATAFNLINAERNRCGFGVVAQDLNLDAAAASHAAYTPQSTITGEDLHSEVPGRAGFTGVTPTDRAVAKGYAGTASEGMGLGTGTTAVRGLLSAPYHLRGLLDGYRDIGIGMAPSSIPDLPYFVADVGTKNGAGLQQLASNDVVTYPCNGTTGVNYQLRGETPNPVPGRNLSTNPIGTPILVKVRDGNVLTITNAAMVNVSTGAGVVLRAPVGASNDPNRVNGVAYFKASEAYVAPDAPLTAGTTYQVTVTGTNNGVAIGKDGKGLTFSFTTGTGIN